MAKRKLAKRRKMQPAVLSMEFLVPTGTSYVDLALAASIVNRRAYSQQYKYTVAGFELLGSTTGTFAIGKLPETWVYQNAYTKARAMWNEMQAQVLENEDGIQGKYHDFKIYLNAAMRAEQIQCSITPDGKILTPIDSTMVDPFTLANFTASAQPRANYDFATVQIPNDTGPGGTVEYDLVALGPSNANCKGIIEGYAKSRQRPQEQDPNVSPGEGWMNELFDVGEQLDNIRDDIVDDNDRPPYALFGAATTREGYPGGSEEQTGVQIHSFCNFTTTTVSGKNSIMGGVFQNGLMQLDNNTTDVVSMIIHMVPGNHRGYLCEAM